MGIMKKTTLRNLSKNPYVQHEHLVGTQVRINSPRSFNHGKKGVVHSIEPGCGYCCVRVLGTNMYLTFNTNNLELYVGDTSKQVGLPESNDIPESVDSVGDESFTIDVKSHTEMREVVVKEMRMKFDNDMSRAVLKDINGDGPKTEYEDELVELFYEKLDKALRS